MARSIRRWRSSRDPSESRLTQGLPPLHMAHTDGAVQPAGTWYRNFEYSVEQERGLDFQEDLFNPFVLTFDLNRNSRAAVVASTEPRSVGTADALRAAEIERRRKIVAAAPSSDPFVRRLAQAADQFIVAARRQCTVIAGYPLVQRLGPRHHDCAARPHAGYGPLRCGEEHSAGFRRQRGPRHAAESLSRCRGNAGIQHRGCHAVVLRSDPRSGGTHRRLRVRAAPSSTTVLADIIAWHERGTRYGIRVDADGLLMAGEPGVQLTWMDAKVGDWVVTPRRGKPVEIQALWYNALRVMEEFAPPVRTGVRMARITGSWRTARSATFPSCFGTQSAGCLYDVVNGSVRDASIRPNQIFAVSLFHKMLPPEKAQSVVDVVERHLLTPYGLRSLAPGDPQYRGRYEGNPCSRDGAYHQGTVWPWLLGPFVTAYLEVNGPIRGGPPARQASGWLNSGAGLKTKAWARFRRFSMAIRRSARWLHRAGLERGGTAAGVR